MIWKAVLFFLALVEIIGQLKSKLCGKLKKIQCQFKFNRGSYTHTANADTLIDVYRTIFKIIYVMYRSMA